MTARRVLSAIVDALGAFAQLGPRVARLERLYATPQADLARRGTTREAEVARLFR